MNIPCKQAIWCNAGAQSQANGFDYPVQNFTSEAPDKEIFIAIGYGPFTDPPPLGTTYGTPGCVSYCESTVSQDEADLCAARQQILCLNGDPGNTGGTPDGTSNPTLGPSVVTPGPGPIPGTNLFGNFAQQCSQACPDGQLFTETVFAGEVIAKSQSQADSTAHSIACKRVAQRIICATGLNGFDCSDPFHENPEYSYTFAGVTPHPPLVWTVSGGSLPPGLTLETGGQLHGFPNSPGNYSFTVKATNSLGGSITKDCTFVVLGITQSSFSLSDATVDQPYSHQFDSNGTAINYSITSGSLPHGLTMNEFGLVTGTPDTLAGSLFTVTTEDNFGNECSQQVSLTIKGPKITCPGAGQVCVAYTGDVTASPAGCVFTGTPPANLAMTSGGHLTGTPKTVAPFQVTATDPSGNINVKTCSFITNAGLPASIQDIGAWSFLHTGDGSGTGNLAAGGGALASSYVWGSVGAPGNCDWNGGTSQSTSPDFRNCGPAYTATVKVDYTIPATPCPNNPSHVPGGGLEVLFNGISIMNHVSLGPLFGGAASGTFTTTVSIPINSTGNHFTASVYIQGGGTFTINVTITPLTPP